MDIKGQITIIILFLCIQYASSTVFAEETFDNDMKEINDESNSWKNVSMKMPINRSIFQGSLNVCRQLK